MRRVQVIPTQTLLMEGEEVHEVKIGTIEHYAAAATLVDVIK